MIIGIPKEIKDKEFRVAIVPAGVRTLTTSGHQVIIEKNAGMGSGIGDDEYIKTGAEIADSAELVYNSADMIMKVKEPLESEYPFLRKGLILYTYLHLGANVPLARELIGRKVAAVAYETIELPDHSLPCLTPTSEIAGRLSVQEGAKYLEKAFGGRGILLGGVP